jgi:hypothetical protein
VLRDAEVEDLHSAVTCQHDVVRLQVTMRDAGGVRRREPVGDLSCDVEGLAQGRRQRAQGFALDELGHDVHRALLDPYVVQGEDVGVIQGRDDAGFLAGEVAGVHLVRAACGKQLEGDFTLEPCVAGAIHLAHGAGPEMSQDLIDANRGAGTQWDSRTPRIGRRHGTAQRRDCSAHCARRR